MLILFRSEKGQNQIDISKKLLSVQLYAHGILGSRGRENEQVAGAAQFFLQCSEPQISITSY